MKPLPPSIWTASVATFMAVSAATSLALAAEAENGLWLSLSQAAL